MSQDEIHLWGVRQNNLKNIEVKIPLGKMTVVCGPSGSGKSSLAFETLFAEGQRRFIESMSNYARQFLNKAPKPDIDGINNIPPAISIEQKNSVRNSRSTVGTTTEVIDYLRLLFEKIALSYCPTHNCVIEKETVSTATDRILREIPEQRGYLVVEIPEKDRVADPKKLLALFLADGYARIFIPEKKKKSKKPIAASAGAGELIELQSPELKKSGVPASTFYLLIDRMVFSEQERGRLTDSLTQAFEASLKFSLHRTFRQAWIFTTEGKKLRLTEEAVCPQCDYAPPPITSKILSFNSPIGACPGCKGFGNKLEIDVNKVIPNPKLSLQEGVIHPFSMPSAGYERKKLLEFCKREKISMKTAWEDLPTKQREQLWNGQGKNRKEFFGVLGFFEYMEQMKYKMHVRVFLSRYRSPFLCTECLGGRLRKETLYFKIQDHNLQSLSALTIENLKTFFDDLKISVHQEKLSAEILKQINSRLNYLGRVGVGYLTLNRETRTLSGGEYQRLILAHQLGMMLSQTLYVLDEPTVGLHPRDNDRLISILKDLKNLGNTLVIVEHDHDVIENAEYVLEMGPGSGIHGGEVVFFGKKDDFLKSNVSITAPYMRSRKKWNPPREVRPVDMKTYKFKLDLTKASGNNLKNVSVSFPLHRLVGITGVSGSGKSTLISKTLYPALAKELKIENLPVQKFDKIKGVEKIKNVLLIDQSSIGRSARSSPVTYMKAFDGIRTMMSQTFEAKARGYTPGTFSLNVDGGRCPSCRGTGFEEIDMMFMDNVVIACDICDGKKYRKEILEIEFQGKNIFQILSMTVAEAMSFFVSQPQIRKPLSVLKEVGLEYLQLGQRSSSLSGGESQRLKIAKELSQVTQKDTLYILDEPTTGLHFREIELLMKVLHKLIESGGSVIVVEHNLDVLLGCDYLIDLGPDAGEKGGKIVAEGSPQDIMNTKKSLTGQYLRRYINPNVGNTQKTLTRNQTL